MYTITVTWQTGQVEFTEHKKGKIMEIFDMSDEQLMELAVKYEIDSPKAVPRKRLEELVQVAQHKRRMELEEKARVERTKELEAMNKIDPASKANTPSTRRDVSFV